MVSNPLIVISALVIFSYLFDLFARKTRFPSVVLLLLTGIGLQYLVKNIGVDIPDFSGILPLLGTIGLILIVLEGALELNFTRSKLPMIRQSFWSAFFILLGTASALSGLFYYVTGAPYMDCLLFAVPYSVISSAIAIPSVARLPEAQREFIVYESSFSDILGVTFFNFALINQQISFSSITGLGVDIILIGLLAIVSCLLLLYIMGRITHKVKFFLIISIIMLIYALGKKFHLPTLIIVLAFGLLLRNAHLIRNPWFKRVFSYKGEEEDLHQLTIFSAESAFLARTFFFLLFGFTMNVDSLFENAVLQIGLPVLLIIYLLRFAYLKFVAKRFLPEFFIAPRGLISVLLLFSIPVERRLSQVTDGVLFSVVLITSLMIVAGLMFMPKGDAKS